MSEGATCASMRLRPLTPRQRAHIEEQRCATRSSMSFSLACARESRGSLGSVGRRGYRGLAASSRERSPCFFTSSMISVCVRVASAKALPQSRS
jgi:hypothetical protein